MHLSGTALEVIFKCINQCSRTISVCSDCIIPERQPRGFAFVQFVDPYEASEAQYHMNEKIFAGREMSMVVVAETRKRPEEICHRARVRGPSGYGGRQSSYYEHSRSRSLSRSRSPRHPSGSKNRYHSRSYSHAPRRRGDYSVSPSRRQLADHPRSPGGPRREQNADHDRSYSPGYANAADQNENCNGHRNDCFSSTSERVNPRNQFGSYDRYGVCCRMVTTVEILMLQNLSTEKRVTEEVLCMFL
ncbi:hypothetical protein F2P56_028457 [Juglans regia]|uniref:RRM domain-containing protein n=1 Tax=Juglans regia TaxID=51240 RepID=A0A833TSI7_JUGRE|nr:hypothetical protein F2P56_028457 [Juglans regia]